MAKLTPKQRIFCNEYIIDLNATKAAIRAGYSEKTARMIGNENLTKPNVQTEIQKAMKEREERTNINADRVVKDLAKIGFADITKFVEFGPEERIEEIEEGTGVKVIRVYSSLRLKHDYEVDGAVISEVKVTNTGVSIKLHDKLKALELLGKHLGMFIERQEVTGKDGGPIMVRFVDPKP